MSTRRGNPYQYDDRPRSSTTLRDRYGNLTPGYGDQEYTGPGADGTGVRMGHAPRATGLHTGTLDQGANPEPSAFDAFFGNRRAVAPQPAPRPTAPAGPSPAAAAATAIGTGLAPLAGLANPLMGGAVAPSFHAPVAAPSPTVAPARPQAGAGAFTPVATGLPSNPDDRALLLETRARDAAAKAPAPISIPGGDPAARAWNSARGTGHPSTPEPGAPVVAPPARASVNPVDPYAVAAAGTGRTIKTPYGTASSTGGGVSTPAVWSNTGVTHPALPTPAAATASPMDMPGYYGTPPPPAGTTSGYVNSFAPPSVPQGAASPMATAPAAVPSPAVAPPAPRPMANAGAFTPPIDFNDPAAVERQRKKNQAALDSAPPLMDQAMGFLKRHQITPENGY